MEVLLALLALLTLTLAATPGEPCWDKTCEFTLTLTLGHTMTLNHPGGHVEDLVLHSNGCLKRAGVENETPCQDVGLNEAGSHIVSGDGRRRSVLLVNGQFPGPTLEVTEGAMVIVHVRNHLSSVSTTMHWHGMTMAGSQWMDGPSFMTQCPIPPQHTFTYRFRASPVGTHWYHPHHTNLRSDGHYGLLIVHKKPDPPIPELPLILSDWFQGGALGERVVNYRQGFLGEMLPMPVSSLINGRGRHHSIPDAPLSLFHLAAGKRYLFRCVNAASDKGYEVKIDHHLLTIVAWDGSEIKPIKVDSFNIFPGERVDFIITGKPGAHSSWIRAVPVSGGGGHGGGGTHGGGGGHGTGDPGAGHGGGHDGMDGMQGMEGVQSGDTGDGTHDPMGGMHHQSTVPTGHGDGMHHMTPEPTGHGDGMHHMTPEPTGHGDGMHHMTPATTGHGDGIPGMHQMTPEPTVHGDGMHHMTPATTGGNHTSSTGTDQAMIGHGAHASADTGSMEGLAILSYGSRSDPISHTTQCTATSKCIMFNCIQTHHAHSNITCVHLRDIQSTDKAMWDKLKGPSPTKDIFINVASNIGSSIGGYRFVPPLSPFYRSQPLGLISCAENCGDPTGEACWCSNRLELGHNELVHLVISNYESPDHAANSAHAGHTTGHPMHIHGHRFAVVAQGFSTLNPQTGERVSDNIALRCESGLCRTPQWSSHHSKPDLHLDHPPLKDTINVAPGGFAVLRLRTDNPGYWLLHCHLVRDLLGGMGLYLEVAPEMVKPPPAQLPPCFPSMVEYNEEVTKTPLQGASGQVSPSKVSLSTGELIAIILSSMAAGIVLLLLVFLLTRRCCRRTPKGDDLGPDTPLGHGANRYNANAQL